MEAQAQYSSVRCSSQHNPLDPRSQHTRTRGLVAVYNVRDGLDRQEWDLEQMRNAGDGGALHLLDVRPSRVQRRTVVLAAVQRVAGGDNAALEAQRLNQPLGGRGVVVPDAVLVKHRELDAAVVVPAAGADVDVADGAAARLKAA